MRPRNSTERRAQRLTQNTAAAQRRQRQVGRVAMPGRQSRTASSPVRATKVRKKSDAASNRSRADPTEPRSGSPITDKIAALNLVIDSYQERILRLPEHLDVGAAVQRLNLVRSNLREPVKLSFIGNFKVGKSQVINSLLGECIAPVNVKRSTAIICYFRYGDQKQVRFHYRNGDVREGGLFDFAHWADHSRLGPEEEVKIRQMSHVEVTFPNPVLRDVTLVDTPGFGSEAEADDEVTSRHLREADAVCWVFDAEQPGKEEEIERIRKLSPLFRSAFALVNKCDGKPPSDRSRLRDHLRKLLPAVFEDVLLYSATTVLTREMDPDATSHLCMNLPKHVEARIGARKEQLRFGAAGNAIAELATENHRTLTDVAKSYQPCVALLENDVPRWMERESVRIRRKYDQRRKSMENRLYEMARQNQARIRNCIVVEGSWWSSDTYTLNLPPKESVEEFVRGVVDSAFRDWRAFIQMIPRQSLTSFLDYLETPVADNPPLRAEHTSLRESLERICERSTLSLELQLVDLFSHSLEGNIHGFLRTLEQFPVLLKDLANQTAEGLARIVQRVIMVDDVASRLAGPSKKLGVTT